ncbi:hypothetical protein [Plesiocystis pacifica]|uniref:hypothetical protein n=1 Tax=Plesiocystis pacifica TaxID=191768 RepID=UPI0005D470E2|nr:hypothetical protein [Plesiocystis pacifica]
MSDKEKKRGERKFVVGARVELRTRTQPEHNNWTRHLSFKNHDGEYKRWKLDFSRKSDRLYSAEFPDGFEVLNSMIEPGGRSYWDSMYLENRGGRTELPLAHLLVELHYEDPAGNSPRDMDHSKIPILDGAITSTLRAGNHKVALNGLARRSRYAWAGVDSSHSSLVRRVARDLGKCGSDGPGDAFGKNCKYGGAVKLLCSEFASWYYYQEDIEIGGEDFRDIVGTQKMHDAFVAADRAYRWHNGRKAWIHKRTEAEYIPKAGDFLERRGADGDAEHAMIMLRWDAANREAIVFNGPWPVTLRRVKVHEEEIDKGKDYWVGRI